MDTEALIAILEDKRAEVMAKDQAAYFIREWQELRDQVRQMSIRLEGIHLDDLGRAKRVTVDKDNTTIIDGGGAQKTIEGRIKQLRARSKKPPRITIARSCKSGWRSWLAAWRLSG
jgi:hypothetical protein